MNYIPPKKTVHIDVVMDRDTDKFSVIVSGEYWDGFKKMVEESAARHGTNVVWNLK